MGIYSKTLFQVGVNGRKVHPVIQRDQYKSNDHVPDQIAKYDLEIIKISAPYTTRHAYKSYPAERCADHAKRHQHPVAVAVADKKDSLLELREVK